MTADKQATYMYDVYKFQLNDPCEHLIIIKKLLIKENDDRGKLNYDKV
jgi:hypothetical protein